MSTKRKFLSTFNRVSTTGFTLVELLVSMGVFAVILTVVIAVFVSASRKQHLLTEFMLINNDVGSALEQMAREIRTGYYFESAGGVNCPGALDFKVLFNGINEDKVSYSLSNDGGIVRSGPGAGVGRLTSTNVLVSDLCFMVIQDESPDNMGAEDSNGNTRSCNPWRVVISMKVESNSPNPDVKDKIKPVFVQTTVSSRALPKEAQGDEYRCRKTKAQ